MPWVEDFSALRHMGGLSLRSTMNCARTARSAIRRQSRCKVPVVYQLVTVKTGRKLYSPAVQRMGAEQKHWKSHSDWMHFGVKITVTAIKRVIAA
jgi:hypothetical protein